MRIAWGVRRGPFITPQHFIHAKAKQIHSHVPCIAQQPDFRSLGMGPQDRRLPKAQAAFSRHVEDLDVEAESAQALAVEDGEQRSAPIGLESALRVRKRETGEETNEDVEDPSRPLSRSRLGPYDEATVEAPRAKGDVRAFALDEVEQTVGFRNGRREIGIRDEDDLSARVQKAATHAVSLPEVSRVLQQAHAHAIARPRSGERFHKVRCPIPRTIVHNDHFTGKRALFEIVQDLAERSFDPMGLIKGRDDDREIRRSLHALGKYGASRLL